MDTQRLEDLAVSDTGFVFDPMTGETFSANGTALLILSGLKDQRDRVGLVAMLRDAFEVRGEDIARDVDDFIAQLREVGLLTAEVK